MPGGSFKERTENFVIKTISLSLKCYRRLEDMNLISNDVNEFSQNFKNLIIAVRQDIFTQNLGIGVIIKN